MGEAWPERRIRPHQAAAWGLTVLTLAVLAPALAFTVLNTSRIGTAQASVSWRR